MDQKIYFDNNATTSIAPEVLAILVEELKMHPSNPSSVHHFGQQAKLRLSKARQTIASLLSVRPTEILFTSGGTESMNLLIQGFCADKKPGHIITSNIEHSCVNNTLKKMQEDGWEISFLSTGTHGAVLPEEVLRAIKDNTKAIVLSSANSETGVKIDIEKISLIAQGHKIPFILDAVGIFGKDDFSIPSGVSAAGFSSHKFHGPKGSGFCFVRSPYIIKPITFGGSQEFALRAGTENLPGILAQAKACELLALNFQEYKNHILSLRTHFETELIRRIPNCYVNGEGERISNVSNIYFKDVDAETLLIQLDMSGVLASHGSACSSGSIEPSRVLLGMGYSKERARSSLRFSFGRYNTIAEVETALNIIQSLVEQMR